MCLLPRPPALLGCVLGEWGCLLGRWALPGLLLAMRAVWQEGCGAVRTFGLVQCSTFNSGAMPGMDAGCLTGMTARVILHACGVMRGRMPLRCLPGCAEHPPSEHVHLLGALRSLDKTSGRMWGLWLKNECHDCNGVPCRGGHLVLQ